MAAFKRQHYLPSGYLKFFADKSVRDGPMIWRIDKTAQRLVHVRSQCAKDYHYSKRDPLGAEGEFWGNERLYCEAVEAVTKGKMPSELEAGAFVMSMFILQLRNDMHVNSTGREGIDAYRIRFSTFLEKVLLRNHGGNVTREALQMELWQNWGMRIFGPPPGGIFITSDNPSVWTCIFGGAVDGNNGVDPLQMVSLPITPSYMAFAYDKSILNFVSDQMNYDDYQTLNSAQFETANDCLYASSPLAPELVETVRGLFAKRQKSRPKTTEDKCHLQLHRIAEDFRFSFLRRTPPLM